jgi:hypothetical protein
MSAKKKSQSKKSKASKKSLVNAPEDLLQPDGSLPPNGIQIVQNVLVVNMIPNSLSGESEQDSEPFLAVNPTNTKEIVGTAFTPDPFGGPNAPIFFSNDEGKTWSLKSNVPSDEITGDITVTYSGNANKLYSGILKLPGNLLLNVLRTTNPSSVTPMNVLSNRNDVDQPFVQAKRISSKDRVYVGNNDLSVASGKTATIDLTLNGSGAAPAFIKSRLEKRSTGTAGQNGPQVRIACHKSGVVYATFYGWRSFSTTTNKVKSDVVVVRDDNGGSAAATFSDLVDSSDGIAGMRVAKNVSFVWDGLLGNQRLGGDLTIAVDPNNSKTVYLVWADVQTTTGYTLHLRRSLDGGATWLPQDLRTIAKGKNPSLAINSDGKVAFLYQQVVGQRWATKVERTTDGFTNFDTLVLADTPVNNPAVQFQPYLGDYVHILAQGKNFYGVFSASNLPKLSNFPSGIKYQRNANFKTNKLLANNKTTTVPVSIDPFFFKITE